MSRSDATHPNELANIRFDHDPDLPDYRSEPAIIPDHGRQPRLKRPTLVVYRSDPHNGRHLYRPADDPYRMSLDEGVELDDRRFDKEREIVRLLMKTAKYHAPRLSRRRDSLISEAMEFELLPAARLIAKPLPPDARSRVLAKFTDVIWDEIKQNRRITKI
jgi:hypothetical protein